MEADVVPLFAVTRAPGEAHEAASATSCMHSMDRNRVATMVPIRMKFSDRLTVRDAD